MVALQTERHGHDPRRRSRPRARRAPAISTRMASHPLDEPAPAARLERPRRGSSTSPASGWRSAGPRRRGAGSATDARKGRATSSRACGAVDPRPGMLRGRIGRRHYGARRNEVVTEDAPPVRIASPASVSHRSARRTAREQLRAPHHDHPDRGSSSRRTAGQLFEDAALLPPRQSVRQSPAGGGSCMDRRRRRRRPLPSCPRRRVRRKIPIGARCRAPPRPPDRDFSAITQPRPHRSHVRARYSLTVRLFYGCMARVRHSRAARRPVPERPLKHWLSLRAHQP